MSVKPFSYGKNKYMLLGIGSKDCCRTLGERHRYKIRMKKKIIEEKIQKSYGV